MCGGDDALVLVSSGLGSPPGSQAGQAQKIKRHHEALQAVSWHRNLLFQTVTIVQCANLSVTRFILVHD
jgi:hypothetical protein